MVYGTVHTSTFCGAVEPSRQAKTVWWSGARNITELSTEVIGLHNPKINQFYGLFKFLSWSVFFLGSLKNFHELNR